ncbi:hypothetical protein GCM10023334_076220 [Nonomuraea thailandensis]
MIAAGTPSDAGYDGSTATKRPEPNRLLLRGCHPETPVIFEAGPHFAPATLSAQSRDGRSRPEYSGAYKNEEDDGVPSTFEGSYDDDLMPRGHAVVQVDLRRQVVDGSSARARRRRTPVTSQERSQGERRRQRDRESNERARALPRYCALVAVPPWTGARCPRLGRRARRAGS